MGNSKRLSSYRDVINTFDAVLREGGGELEFTTREKAASWQQRAYHFRRIRGESEYDIIQLHRPAPSRVIKFVVLDTPEALGAVFKGTDGQTKSLDFMEAPSKKSGPLALDVLAPVNSPEDRTVLDEEDQRLIEEFSKLGEDD